LALNTRTIVLGGVGLFAVGLGAYIIISRLREGMVVPTPVPVAPSPRPLPPPEIPMPQVGVGSSGGYVFGLQARLKDLGFDPGPIDGVFGPKTQIAVKDFQADVGLPITGVVDSATWKALFTGRELPTLRRGSAGPYVRLLQARLKDYGFDPGPVDGVFGSGTEAAVRKFQSAFWLVADGIVGPTMWASLVPGIRG